jgi:hypothetical protein
VVAKQIPGAKLIPLPVDRDYPPYLGDVEIGPSKWIRWGRLMGLVEAEAIHGYWPAQMVHR